jgi:ABC-type sugar transport system ATPase subunit
MPSLALDNVTVRHRNGSLALDAVDLTVPDGRLCVLVGPSGCGKTTVLRTIAGLATAESGRVLLDGQPIDHLPTNERGMAMVFQDNLLYPHLTVRRNLAFALRIAGDQSEGEISRRVEQVAAVLRLGDVLDRMPQKLSGGQQQRTALGRAIIREPRLLLMDEPLSNLDAKLRTEMRSEIMRIQRQLGITTVFVTHDQVEAMAMADTVAVMDAGRIVQVGPPMDLYDRPGSVFVARFLGDPEINLLAARVTIESGLPALRSGSVVMSLDPCTPTGQQALARVGDAVCAGIRAAGITLDPSGDLVASAITVEQRQFDQLVTVRIPAYGAQLDGGRLRFDREPTTEAVVSLPLGVPVDIWRPLRLSIATDRLVLFDPATTTALAEPAPNPAPDAAPLAPAATVR